LTQSLGDLSLGELAEMFRRTPVALAVIDMTTGRVTVANDQFATLYRLDPSELNGFDLLAASSAENQGVVERVLTGMAWGIIDSCQGRAVVHLPHGDTIEILAAIRPLGASRPRTRAILVAAQADGAPLSEPWLTLDPRRVVFGVVDQNWCLSQMSADAAELLDWDHHGGPGTPLPALVHPDDVSLLLVTLGRSGAERRAAATRLRVRGSDGRWSQVRLTVSPLGDHNPSRFAVTLSFLPPVDDAASSGDRASRLEGHLWRIAVEVQAAGIGDLAVSGEARRPDAALTGLTRRQSEILRGLRQGQRVHAIAQRLFVSESTVRNHLSAIYRKVGVHSQSELLARLAPGGSASTD
jgi:DNA-binding CsgD family transcriptional regulator/PAS domain-containing protein